MYQNNYPPPFPQQQPQPPPRQPQDRPHMPSPHDYMMQKKAAMTAEKKALRINVTKLAGLLILYNVFNDLFVRVFYMVVYCFVEKPTLSMNYAIYSLQQEHAEMLKGTAFRMGAMLFTVVFSVLGVFLAAQFLLKTEIASWFKPNKENVKTGFLWSMPCVTVNLIMSVFVALIVERLTDEGVNVPSADFSIKSPSTLALTLQFLYVCIAGPVAEEIIYRGLVIKLISPYGKGLAVFVSALFFGLMHGNLEQTVPTFVGGMLFALIAVYSDSLVPTIIVHIMNNTIASINDFGKALGSDFSKIYLAVAIIFMVVGFYVLMVFLTDMVKDLERNNNYALSAGTRTLTVFLNIVMIAYMSIYLIYPYIMSFIKSN